MEDVEGEIIRRQEF